MEYILKNKEEYKNFISTGTVEQYTENKSRDGVWGDSLEMCVFAQIFQIQILIYFYDDYPSNVLKPQTEDNTTLCEWRYKIYRKCIALDQSIGIFLTEIEAKRNLSTKKIQFSLLYKNGNHYDALYEISEQEYLIKMEKYLKEVKIFKFFNFSLMKLKIKIKLEVNLQNLKIFGNHYSI